MPSRGDSLECFLFALPSISLGESGIDDSRMKIVDSRHLLVN